MAKQVVWSLRAQADRKEILNYWRLRNKSNNYSKKLNQLFKESVRIITDSLKLENQQMTPIQGLKSLRII